MSLKNVPGFKCQNGANIVFNDLLKTKTLTSTTNKQTLQILLGRHVKMMFSVIYFIFFLKKYIYLLKFDKSQIYSSKRYSPAFFCQYIYF